MSYDLVAWPVGVALSAEQAIAQIKERTSRWPVGIGRDRRAKSFVVANGLALVAIALLDWRRFRWRWLLVALVAVIAVWTATGHPLLFLVVGL